MHYATICADFAVNFNILVALNHFYCILLRSATFAFPTTYQTYYHPLVYSCPRQLGVYTTHTMTSASRLEKVAVIIKVKDKSKLNGFIEKVSPDEFNTNVLLTYGSRPIKGKPQQLSHMLR